MYSPHFQPWLTLLAIAASCPAWGTEALDSGIRDITAPDGRQLKEFHCKIPKGYGVTSPKALSHRIDEDFGELPAPPPPDPSLCLRNPNQFNEDRAAWLFEQSVLNPQKDARGTVPQSNTTLKLNGAPDLTLTGSPEEFRLMKRLMTNGLSEGKKPVTTGQASWSQAAQVCFGLDPICALTQLYQSVESAFLAMTIAKTTQYFPSLTQWYPVRGPGGEDWTQRWSVEDLRSFSHAFAMLPPSASRFPIDKDLRRLPPGTVIGDCPSGSSLCRANDPWPRTDDGTPATIGMAQVWWYGASGDNPFTYRDSYLLITDRLMSRDRKVSCWGVVHELTHHLDFSFQFDPTNLTRSSAGNRQSTIDRLSREWGVRGFGRYSSLPVADAVTGQSSTFADMSWKCQGENCVVRSDESAGFVSSYARKVGPMDDFAESVANYVCDPVQLLIRSPQKYNWLKTHLFADRSSPRAAPREFWTPDHEKWRGFDQALQNIGSDRLLDSCLNSFRQIRPSGPNVAAYFPDPDPTQRRNGLLRGFFVEDVLSQYNCVAEISNQIDSQLRAGPDPQYCAMGSQETVQFLTSKRAGYAAAPFMQALANVAAKDRALLDFPSLANCRAADPDSCAFLRRYRQELSTFQDALTASGVTDQGRARAITKILSLLKN